MKIYIGVSAGRDISESTKARDYNLRTFMDFQNIKTCFPKLSALNTRARYMKSKSK